MKTLEEKNNIIYLSEYKEKMRKDFKLSFEDLERDISIYLKQKAINNIDKVLDDLSEMRKDIYDICNNYNEENYYTFQEQDYHNESPRNITIPIQDYNKYKRLKKLLIN